MRLILITPLDRTDPPFVGRMEIVGPAVTSGFAFGIRVMHEIGPDDYRPGGARWITEGEVRDMEWFNV